MKKFIYVIGPKDGPYKIGYSNDPHKRLSTIQTGQAVDVFLHHYEDVVNGDIIEKLIHKQINHKRIRGEWFKISLEDAILEIKYAIMTHESDDLLPIKKKYKLI